MAPASPTLAARRHAVIEALPLGPRRRMVGAPEGDGHHLAPEVVVGLVASTGRADRTFDGGVAPGVFEASALHHAHRLAPVAPVGGVLVAQVPAVDTVAVGIVLAVGDGGEPALGTLGGRPELPADVALGELLGLVERGVGVHVVEHLAHLLDVAAGEVAADLHLPATHQVGVHGELVPSEDHGLGPVPHLVPLPPEGTPPRSGGALEVVAHLVEHAPADRHGLIVGGPLGDVDGVDAASDVGGRATRAE